MATTNNKSERVRKMKENFMSLREQGMSFREIADKFSLHYTTVYAELESIAQANGVSRVSLLYEPHSKHSPACKCTRTTLEEMVNIEETQSAFENAINDINTIIVNIDQIIEKDKEINN